MGIPDRKTGIFPAASSSLPPFPQLPPVLFGDRRIPAALRQGSPDFVIVTPRNSSMDEEIENPYWSVRALVQQYEGQQPHPSR